jgi:hypothetical protein
MSILRRIEKTLDERLRGIFGGGASPGSSEAIELYRDALDQIASRASVAKSGNRKFPFNRITVELRADDPERKAVLETVFDAGHFGDDVRTTLKEERVTPPADLTVVVSYPETPQAEVRVICERTDHANLPAARQTVQIVPARLLTIIGISSAPEFALEQQIVNLGREEQVVDSLGRAVRRNELFFPEAAHEANPSVSRSHAHIRFDGAAGEWRIFDDGSSIGTTLFRKGKRIDVPAHAGRGVALRPGDEIYLGQVRLRFEVS